MDSRTDNNGSEAEARDTTDTASDEATADAPSDDAANGAEAAVGQAAEAAAGDDAAARIAELETQAAALKEQLLRAMAETENVRKRSERQLTEAHEYAIANFARSVLTVADDLSRAIAAVPEEKRQGDELFETLLGGVEAVERELMKVLSSHHIERIDPQGEPFDPNFHEAMYEVPDTDLPDGTVAQVLQPGYRLRDRLLRPARVGVAKGGNKDAGVDTTV